MTSTLIKFVIDLALWLMAALLAYTFRTPSVIQGGAPSTVWLYALLNLGVMVLVIRQHRLHRQLWQRVSVPDLLTLARAAATATLVMFALGFILRDWLQLARSVPLLAGALGFLLMGGARLLFRMVQDRIRQQQAPARQRVLIVGAGEAGALIAREIQRHPESGLQAIGFLDDEPAKQRQSLMGFPVFGRVENLVEVAQREHAQEVLIAIPSAEGSFIRRVVELSQAAKLRYRIIPGVFEILSGNVTINQIRDVDLEDLLRRPPVQLNTAEIAGYLRGRVVLVTGAGGSIGSEIVRQICVYQPGLILLVGRGENSIFSIQQELNHTLPDIKHLGLICDVRDRSRLDAIFQDYRPDVVFHAAAHKHVPLMEMAPSEAIMNNVTGTHNVTQLCLQYHIKRLVNVSTDKAVNPTSVMGASKRMAEMIVSAGAACAAPDQAFVSVRFGNVLGSRGSVVPTFMRQIRAGGPITVTHPDMVRYFMTIPEAARLVLQAGGLAENGKVYVLNMGQPVRIADLAQDVIQLSGAQHVDIVYSGVRPGEKLYEELLTTSEGAESTTHQEIFSARLASVNPAELEQNLALLRQAAEQQDHAAIRETLARLIPENKFGSLG
ncbi:nucleoside-diphosphate sugar epimerase/dehydratase [Deinococcus xianganensis]|uniref:SDR family NAD(P)-dependent oxidoreductase n=1 Tax=Deinococcus xianganensis TaxID=1507289 RepID=A0A6I4YA68_9DEIO|nr:nucleoside-diphosphate sugar epimerase/dehydratase [Deinococcus xianganensis]MXV18262.1 SDR family NAD(P)-dependent oxidoreductase [Deinococcus xianganensis]